MELFHYSDAELVDGSEYILPAVEGLLRKVPSSAVIADLGCGNGSVLAKFRQRGWQMYGLDRSNSGLEQARNAYPGIHFEFADLCTDISGHRLAGQCDVVLSPEVIEHIFLPRIYARNCYTLLKPNGLLVLSTPYHGYLKNQALAATGRMDPHFTALWDYGHIKFWSKHTLSILLEEVGFSVTGFQGLGRVPLLWKSMVVTATKKTNSN
jgi:2-polyprenyl-3-methyl-5-hydroxy-6-metoxy-1,4-benzoquinol methylase